MPTVLVFPASVSQNKFVIPTGSQKSLGTINVSTFSKIRVVASNFPSSPTPIHLLLTFTSGPGGARVAQLDTIILSPGNQQTKMYDIPGTFLEIIAVAMPGQAGQDTVETMIYGN
ncbi:MAG: hypothetical protein KGI33_07540 [Thaumarchaeota archaeon]|nr:hypothetical protein [Nitrososphaerota archaeon]